MTKALHDLLDDMVANVPGAVAPPKLARRAYNAGRRRRTARHFRLGTLLIVVLFAAALVVPPSETSLLPAATRDYTNDQAGYPERIDVQHQIARLPEKPGRIAALLKLQPTQRGLHGHLDRWQAVSADGYRWDLDPAWSARFPPSLSPDGRRVAYLANANGPYVVIDLMTGTRRDFAEIAENGVGRTARFSLQGYPPRWSPDGHRLLLSGGLRSRQFAVTLLLDSESESVTELLVQGHPAGWMDDERIVWARDTTDGKHGQLTQTDVRGRALASVTVVHNLDLTDNPTGALSRDGLTFAIPYQDAPNSTVLRQFDVRTGIESAPPLPMSHVCSISSGAPAVITRYPNGGPLRSVAVTPKGGTSVLTTISGRLAPSCIFWSDSALDGERHAFGFLNRTRIEVLARLRLLARIVVLVLIAAAGWQVRRARRRRATREVYFAGRRRLGAIIAAAAALMAVAVVGVMTTGSGGVFADDPATTVRGYPSRVDMQLKVRALPTRPGVIAGVFRRGSEWLVFNSTGHQWTLPRANVGAHPSVSRDGRKLAYRDASGRFLVHDLVAGEQTYFPQVPATTFTSEGGDFGYDATPGFWSPDGTRLLLWQGYASGPLRPSLVVDIDARTVSEIPSPGRAFGWVGNEELVWYLSRQGSRVLPMQLDVSDIHGTVQRSIKLTPDIAASDGGWSPAVSPDGRVIALASWDQPGMGVRNGLGSEIRRFDLSSGSEVGDPVRAGGLGDQRCDIAWGERLVVTQLEASGNDGYRPRTVIVGGADIVSASTFPVERYTACVLPAADAFAGPMNAASPLEAVRAWFVSKIVVVAIAVAMTLMVIALWVFERRRLSARPAPD